MEKYGNDIKLWVKSLSLSCPAHQPLPSCPINELRSLPLSEKLATVDRMSMSHLQKLIRHHSECLRGRETVAQGGAGV